jgi:hypothetical protein
MITFLLVAILFTILLGYAWFRQALGWFFIAVLLLLAYARETAQREQAATTTSWFVKKRITVAQLYLARMLQRTFPAGFIAPCLPTKTDKLPSGDLWLHEIKHDGFRVIARKDGDRVRLGALDFARKLGAALD